MKTHFSNRKQNVLIGLLCITLSMASIGCYPQFNEQEVMGPNVRTNLLIFFRQGIERNEISNFWNNVLSTPDPRGGFALLPGICGVSRIVPIPKYDSITVDFCRNITPAQKDEIIKRVRASPIVFKILEDVIPAEVKEIE